MKIIYFILLIQFIGVNHAFSQCSERKLLSKGYREESYTARELLKWDTYGNGLKAVNHEQLVLSEKEGSLGYMIVSPDSYKENVVLCYDIMVLRPATVLIVEMSASNSGDGQLVFPGDYDGNLNYLFDKVQMYMFAFHNAVHNKPGPFVRKYPEPGMDPLVMAKKNVVQTGKYYHVEIGKEGEKLWLTVDGRKILKTTDDRDLKNGKIILRIRGTGPETASCVIRNLKIFSK